jgi:hypothetical protein
MQDHLESVGKTIANIELDHPNYPKTCTIVFTDGTSLLLSAYSTDIHTLFIKFFPKHWLMRR